MSSFLLFNVLAPAQNCIVVGAFVLALVGHAYIPDRKAISDA